ncbi:hypothetical protein [Kribbella speibonae]|uniref:Uncharacterized protein n=1 Tax=Kribbella speibonae TaxID=1572660 RepID=A0A4R0JFS6_9ACTN|nr:hypothetical protein [Kribbella speibonae]TCC18965.1 hypothetical protein E0H58_34540 [Kribbella speibonae]TCC40555.1 hypothetical protein E0H92_02310 [Kribbella speibonae]
MEHSTGTPTNAAAQTRAERQARADWLITELGRLAAQAEDPDDKVRIRRTADSLVRLATAYRS